MPLHNARICVVDSLTENPHMKNQILSSIYDPKHKHDSYLGVWSGAETGAYTNDVIHNEGALFYGAVWWPSAARLHHIDHHSARLIVNVHHGGGLLNGSQPHIDLDPTQQLLVGKRRQHLLFRAMPTLLHAKM